jgi:phospholipid/cholesterol/gamma-HCH transport system permease protein
MNTFSTMPSSNDDYILVLTGDWRSAEAEHKLGEFKKELKKSKARIVRFETSQLTHWNGSFLAYLNHWITEAQANGVHVELDGLPESIQRLLKMAQASQARIFQRPKQSNYNSLEKIGFRAQKWLEATFDMVNFIGEATISFSKILRGHVGFRGKDFWFILENCGARALPIVGLISFLVGMTIAFVGAIQLETFGATIYVANLVGLSMVREMGAMMVGIILCGRTGAAFASELGSMKVSEEINALRTLGLSPMDFLVTPRMLALILMTPLLCIFANFIGMLGGMFVGVIMLDITPFQYMHQTETAFNLTSFSTGVIKSFVFGALVVISGCFQGMRCENSSEGVGRAVTAAVVMGITSIIIADSIFAVIFNALNI